MGWAKIDDRLHSHPKVALAGIEAMGLWVVVLSLACAYRTDGHVTVDQVRKLAGRRGPHLAARLVTAGLWDLVEDGRWTIHDYLDYNPSKAESAEADRARSEAKRAAGQRGGIRSGEVRRAKQSGSSAEAETKQAASDPAKQNEAPSRPVPIPDHTAPTSLAGIWPTEGGEQTREPSRGRPSRADLDRVDRILADAAARPEVGDDLERGVLRSVTALRLGGGYPSGKQLAILVEVEAQLAAPPPAAPFVPRAPHHAPRPELLADPSERAARKKGGPR